MTQINKVEQEILEEVSQEIADYRAKRTAHAQALNAKVDSNAVFKVLRSVNNVYGLVLHSSWNQDTKGYICSPNRKVVLTSLFAFADKKEFSEAEQIAIVEYSMYQYDNLHRLLSLVEKDVFGMPIVIQNDNKADVVLHSIAYLPSAITVDKNTYAPTLASKIELTYSVYTPTN